MRILVCVVLLLAGISSSAKAELQTQTIEYRQADTVLEGYLVYDDQFSGRRPGVLVVHEWMGLNDYAKSRADMLARLGYVAFAADIYGKGNRPQSVAEASAEATKYKSDRLLLRARAKAGLAVLQDQPQVNPNRLAAIGYCFGGTTVLELARSGADLRGVVSFHGGLSAAESPTEETSKARILVLHGAADPFVPESELVGFIQEMKKARAKYRIVQYPGAVHGFTNPANHGEIPGALYDPSADRKSWEEMKVFFDRVLR